MVEGHCNEYSYYYMQYAASKDQNIVDFFKNMTENSTRTVNDFSEGLSKLNNLNSLNVGDYPFQESKYSNNYTCIITFLLI